MRLEVFNSINCKEFLIKSGFSRNILPEIKYNLFNNEKKVKLTDLLEIGYLDIIIPEEESDIPVSNESIDIVYEDEFFLIVNKPRNLCIMPNKNYYLDNLASRIQGYYKKINHKAKTHIITRLDKETRGLVFICKNKYLCNMINIIDKRYFAILEGIVNTQEVILPIKRIDGVKRGVSSDGDYAKTSFINLKQNKNTLVECILHTGRTHQIRVHSSAINHPIVGDALYGNKGEMLLECYYLKFYHPIIKKTLEIKINLDDLFLDYL